MLYVGFITLLVSPKATTSFLVRFVRLEERRRIGTDHTWTGFLALGYLFAFTLSRLEYLSYYGIFCNANGPPGTGAAPGECYYWLQNPFKTGMMLHVFCILPAALLVCLQFIPAIRHNAILFHRLNGYAVITLSLVSSAGTIIVTRHAFGGDFATQTWTGAMGLLTTIGYIMAWINIKFLQIDQHRAWMMRTWAWVCYPTCLVLPTF